MKKKGKKFFLRNSPTELISKIQDQQKFEK